jgi:hypothetical protein
MSQIDKQLPHSKTSFSPEKSDPFSPPVSHGQGRGCHYALSQNEFSSNPATTMRQFEVSERHHMVFTDMHEVSQKKAWSIEHRA